MRCLMKDTHWNSWGPVSCAQRVSFIKNCLTDFYTEIQRHQIWAGNLSRLCFLQSDNDFSNYFSSQVSNVFSFQNSRNLKDCDISFLQKQSGAGLRFIELETLKYHYWDWCAHNRAKLVTVANKVEKLLDHRLLKRSLMILYSKLHASWFLYQVLWQSICFSQDFIKTEQ